MNHIIEARVVEFCQILRSRLFAVCPTELLNSEIVLAGSGSLLEGLGATLQRICDFPVRTPGQVFSNHFPEFNSPGSSCLQGALWFVARELAVEDKSLLNRIRRYFLGRIMHFRNIPKRLSRSAVIAVFPSLRTEAPLATLYDILDILVGLPGK